MRRLVTFFALILSAVARAVPLASPPDHPLHISPPDRLLQLQARTSDSPTTLSNPAHPIPLGRLTLTDDPLGAAAFFADNFDGVHLPPGNRKNLLPSDPACAIVAHVLLPHHGNQTLTFVRDLAKRNPASQLGSVSDVLAAATRQVDEVVRSSNATAWTAWQDNHDGYGLPLHTVKFDAIWSASGRGAQCCA